MTLTGTLCGQLFRCYWHPAALSEELRPGGPPIPLRLFSEDLVMFRDEHGRLVDSTGQRFQPSAVLAAVGPQREQLLPIMVNMWQRAGIDVQHSILPAPWDVTWRPTPRFRAWWSTGLAWAKAHRYRI